MLKSNDHDYHRTAIYQSLLFWRGEQRPSPSAQQNLDGTDSLEAVQKTTKPLDKKDYNSPQPWRFVRWRKAHEKIGITSKGKQETRGNFYHKVLPDEDLFEVSEKYSTYPEVLMEANGILNPANVVTGQVLWVPRTHSIEWGNTLWALSNKYGVSISTIQNANGIDDPDLIYAGDILVIPEEPDNRNAW